MAGDPRLSDPAGLWDYVPNWITEADGQARVAFINWSATHKWFWNSLDWLTRSRAGTAVFLGVLVLIAAYVYFQHAAKASEMDKTNRADPVPLTLQDRIAKIRYFVFSSFGVAVCLGISDGLSNLIKNLMGRYKPRVNLHLAHLDQPYGFPSAHAMNTATLAFLAWVLLRNSSRRLRWTVTLSLIVVSVVTGLSRVVFNEHFPLDISVGWALGALLGLVLGWALNKIQSAFRTSRN